MANSLPKLRVYVSSPGDVGAERAVAVAVPLQLAFRGAVELDAPQRTALGRALSASTRN